DLSSETASGSGTSWLLSATSQSFPHSRTFTEETSFDVLKSWVDDGAAESVTYSSGLRRNQETAGGLTFTYAYDPSIPERLLSKTAPGDTPTREVMLGYDAAGRATTLDWAPFSSVDVGLSYGPLGHLTGKSVTGVGAYTYWYDHDMRLVKQLYPNGTTRRIRFAGGRDPMVDEMGTTKKWEHIYLGGEPVAQVATDTSGSALRLLITDRMGRVRKLTNSSGTSLVRYVWDAWGDSNGPYKVNDTTQNPMPEYAWGLPGQRGTGNGVTLNGWRAYVPETGRYTTPEPLHAMTAEQFYGSLAYSYAASRPSAYVDPDGRQFVPAMPAEVPVEVPAYPEGPMPEAVPMPVGPRPHDALAKPRLGPGALWSPTNPPEKAVCAAKGCNPAGAAMAAGSMSPPAIDVSAAQNSDGMCLVSGGGGRGPPSVGCRFTGNSTIIPTLPGRPEVWINCEYKCPWGVRWRAFPGAQCPDGLLY
ncbi:MAG: hypothetical protein HYS27_27125, partial [Deltaproteobacteria bacterium]|nr:hypothetical protein [Deltaproteobacteria bacterium]